MQDNQPIIVVLKAEETPTASLADVVVGALGITGVLVLSAVVLGVIVAGLMIQWHRWHRPEDDHLPPVSPTS